MTYIKITKKIFHQLTSSK